MTEKTRKAARKVLLLELNEITWRLVEPLCARGQLPMFSEFIREGTRGAPVATEVPPHLDPWVSWTSVYTGRPQDEHGVYFLEQPPRTVQGPRIWDLAVDAGLSVGLYGSIMSWPPRQDIEGFWVPSTFSPGPETVPAHLQPIQELNLNHTRAHSPVGTRRRLARSVGLAFRLLRLGLRMSTCLRLASFLVRSRLRPRRSWEKVSYQPLVNLDFFQKLYGQHRPDLATFHSNHVAHYQHRYWACMDPSPFASKPSPEDQKRFGGAIEFGYQVADELLRRVWRLVDSQTVVIVASGLGQQPFVKDQFPGGRKISRIRDIRQIIDLCGIADQCTPVSMMAPQWNLTIPDNKRRAHAEKVLGSAWVGSPERKLFGLTIVGDTINFNPRQDTLHGLAPDSVCVFPDVGGTPFKLGDLCATEDASPKQGYHDPVGLVILRGPGIRKGAQIGQCSNLDLAPTILHLLGLDIPEHMKGTILTDALDESCDSGRDQPAEVAAAPIAGSCP
jgi:Type I phosphodiesterase / nucleotide pyrophosphatase